MELRPGVILVGVMRRADAERDARCPRSAVVGARSFGVSGLVLITRSERVAPNALDEVSARGHILPGGMPRGCVLPGGYAGGSGLEALGPEALARRHGPKNLGRWLSDL